MAWYLVKHRDNFTFTFAYYTSYPDAVSSIRNPRTHHTVVTGTHITRTVPTTLVKCTVSRLDELDRTSS